MAETLHTFTIAGVAYRCSCGCNVFRDRPDIAPSSRGNWTVYECNACGRLYEGESPTPRETREGGRDAE